VVGQLGQVLGARKVVVQGPRDRLGNGPHGVAGAPAVRRRRGRWRGGGVGKGSTAAGRRVQLPAGERRGAMK
jgi:hypothetical protein